MNYPILLIFFIYINFCSGTAFTLLITDRNVTGVFKLICEGSNPAEEDIYYSDRLLGVVGRRLLPYERLQLRQLVAAVDAGCSYQLSFSMSQVSDRDPHINDLIINCMLRYYEEIRKRQFYSLAGKPLGACGRWVIFPGLINKIHQTINSKIT